MRLELSKELQKKLDQIKDKSSYWPGKGYAKVIAALVRDREERESIEKLAVQFAQIINEMPKKIESAIELAFKTALSNFVQQALWFKNKTEEAPRGSRSGPKRRRK